jgi:hypothetical protein
LEFIVNPDAKSIEEAATAGDDGSGLEWGLVDFEGQVEHREGIHIGSDVVVDEFAFGRGHGTFVFLEPFAKEAKEAGSKGLGVSGR